MEILSTVSEPQKSINNLDIGQKYLSNLEIYFEHNKFDTIKHYKNSNNAAVIVEPREHNLLRQIIKCINFYCNIFPKKQTNVEIEYATDFNIYLIGGNKSENFLKQEFPNQSDNIKFINMEIENINAEQHNFLLQQEIFWQQIKEKHILIFQTDSFMFNPIPKKYLEYDFAGAVAINEHSKTPNKYGQNGGFSLRNRDAMIECIQKVDYQKINNYRIKNNKLIFPEQIIAEDIYFWHALEILNGKIMPQSEAPNFSIETYPNFPIFMGELKPIGIHAFEKNMINPDFLEYLTEKSLNENIYN